MKKCFALLLTLSLLLGMLPSVQAAAAPRAITQEEYAAVDALWAELEQTQTVGLSAVSTASALAEQVQNSSLYQPDTLRWQGNGSFTFETTVGVTCGYSARLMEQLANAAPNRAALAEPAYQTRSYARRGTTSSMDVFLIEPYYGLDDSFTTQYQTEADRLAEAMDGTYHLYTRNEATIDAVADAIEQGGVVIFDSHGDTDYYVSDGTWAGDSTSGATTSYLLLNTGSGLTDADYAYDRGTYHAVYYGRSSDGMYLYAVDGTAIANHMSTSAPDSLIWSAICLGMATDGLTGPLLQKGVHTAYGYSQSVTFYYDYLWEEAFFDALLRGETVAAATAEMKETVAPWDLYEDYPTMEEAIAEHAAFPIVASREDAYPGHGYVDAQQTVRSTWRLPIYFLSVAVNDENLGSAEQDGLCVTARPNENALLTGWSLSPENAATVVQNGNTFTVSDLTADCCLTLHFAERPLATVHYATPEGTVCADDCCYVGQTLLLPTPVGSPTADAEDYRFCGWTTAPVTDSLQKPTVLTGSFTPVEGEQTLYALYTYREKGQTCYTTVLRQAVCYAARFRDVYLDQWYHADIDFAVGEGYMQGYPNGCFYPQETLTRAMLVTILYRLSEDSGRYSQSFTDVPDGEWYADAVAWAYANQVVEGYPDGSFRPKAAVTREEVATIFYRYAVRSGMDTSARAGLDAFADAAQCAAYAQEAMQWMVAEGILNGLPAGTQLRLQPRGNATRAEVTAILHRYCNLLWAE